MTREPLLTPAELIAYLNLGSLSALYRLIREHQLPFRRLGREYRFSRPDVDEWSKGQRPLLLEWARAPRKRAS